MMSKSNDLLCMFPQSTFASDRPALLRLRDHLAEHLSSNTEFLPEAIGVARALVRTALAEEDRAKDVACERLEIARDSYDILAGALCELKWLLKPSEIEDVARRRARRRVTREKLQQVIADALENAQRP